MTDQTTTARYDELTPSPLNPRTTFDEAKLDELAQSIAATGILQNLIARPIAEPANGVRLEIVGGERRYRAVGRAIEAGTIPPEFEIPIKVRELTDVEVLKIAAVENLQRDDLHPMDEAEGYKKLVDAGETTETIAAAIGKTRRHVQLRLALVEKLDPTVRKAFREGEVSLASARILATADTKRQKEALGRIKKGYITTTSHLHRELRDELPKLGSNIFPIEDYTGGFAEHPDDETERYFEDVAQFKRLQRKAITAKKKALEKAGVTVQVFDHSKQEYFHRSYWDKTEDPALARTVIAIDWKYGVEIHESIAPDDEIRKKTAKTAKKKTAAGDDKPKPLSQAFTAAHYDTAHAWRSELLQTAVAGDPKTAKILACLGLMGAGGNLYFDGEQCFGWGALPVADLVETRADWARQKAPKGTLDKEDDGHGPLRIAGRDYENDQPKRVAALYEWLKTLKPRELDQLFAALVAGRLATKRNLYRDFTGDSPLALVLQKDLGINTAEAFTLANGERRLALLDGIRKPGLLNLLDTVDGLSDKVCGSKAPASMPVKALKEGIADHWPVGGKTPAPVTIGFASAATLKKRLTSA